MNQARLRREAPQPRHEGRGARRGVAVLALAAVHLLAGADEARLHVEQRVRLAARLIADSNSAQRIMASGNSQALSHLDEGRLHQSMAEQALQRGDTAAAGRAVDEALRHLSLARRLAPDAPARQAAFRQRYMQMAANLDRLLDTWREQAGSSDFEHGDMTEAVGLISTGRYFAEAGRHEDAVHTLAAAERHVLSGMRQMLKPRELNYTQRAGTPAEELQLELRRHQGLVDLVPLAINELRPRPEAITSIERYGEASRKLRAQALAQSQAGDIAAALAHIRNATLYVQRALGAAGLAMPAEAGSPP